MGSLSTNGAGELLQFDANSKLPVDLNIDGHVFTGSGAGLTDLPGGSITPGTVSLGALDATGTPSVTTFLRGDDTWAPAVTSVGLSVDPVLGTVSGSPVTGSGTLSIAAPVMAAGTFIAGPAAASGAATARTIVATDIDASLSGALDLAFGSARGSLLQRGASGWSVLPPGTAGQVLLTNGVGADAGWGAGASVQVPVRQTVLSGPIDANGFPSFLPATSGSLSVASQNISGTASLVATSSNGFGAAGGIDRVGVASSNLTWTGLAASATNYLYVDIDGAGNLTAGATTLEPVYQTGGTRSTASGQFTFNTAEMVATVGNGSTAVQTWRVFVGEAVAGPSSVTSTVAYAYQGKYDSGYASPLPGTSALVSKNHNLGYADFVTTSLRIKCITIDQGYTVGDVINGIVTWQSSSNFISPTLVPTLAGRNALKFATGADGAFTVSGNPGGSVATLNGVDWAYATTARRNW